MPKFLFAVLASALFVVPSKAAQDCTLRRLASLDMEPIGFGVVVPATIGDHTLHMVVDTGGYLTALSEDVAKTLNLPIGSHPDYAMTLYGGTKLAHYVTVSGFSLGKLKAPTLGYPLLPSGFLPPDIDGLLAPDFLGNFDVDFDFANGKVSLFSKDHCDGRVGWWTTADQLGMIPIHTEDDNVHISMHVMLDGEDMKAMIDTGASRTVMSLEVAQRLFNIKDSDLKDSEGVNKLEGAKTYAFKKMSFGNVEVNHPDIILIPDGKAKRAPNSPRLILGINVLRHLHLYLAYHEEKLYFTPADMHR